MSGKADVEEAKDEESQAVEESQEAEEDVLAEPGEDAGELKRRYLLRRFWKGAAGFWGRRGTRLSWVLSGGLLIIVLLNLATSYGMNVWNRGIFDALEKRDSPTVLFLSLLYVPLLAASVFLSVMQVYARMTLQRRWRAWLNREMKSRRMGCRPM